MTWAISRIPLISSVTDFYVETEVADNFTSLGIARHGRKGLRRAAWGEGKVDWIFEGATRMSVVYFDLTRLQVVNCLQKICQIAFTTVIRAPQEY